MSVKNMADAISSMYEAGKWAGLLGDTRVGDIFYDGEIADSYIPYDELQKDFTADTLAKTIANVHRTKQHNPCWLYMWVDFEESMRERTLVVKFGAARNGPYDRNKKDQNSANFKTIWVCPSMFFDKHYENMLEKINGVTHLKRDKGTIGSDREELYRIEDAKALKAFQRLVEKECGVSERAYEFRRLYIDSLEVIDELLRFQTSAALPCFVLDLPPRAGKSLLSCCLAKALPCRFAIFTSYVNTSCKSIRDIIKHVKGFEHCMWVNPDEADVTNKEIDEWIRQDPRNWVAYYGSLTGTDKKFNERMASAKKFLNQNPDIKAIAVVDEADFGAHTDNQKKKLRKMITWGDFIATFAMTGTNAEKAKNLFKDEKCDGIVTRTIHDLLEIAGRNSAKKGC